ncbi:MAG: outer membrane protein transport protein, partial [Myxococcota bacterium]
PGSVELEVPQVLSFGIAYDVLPELQFEVDVDYVGWNVYDNLTLTLPSFPETPDVREELILERNWEDTVVVRVGGEYNTGKWAVRGGFVYDPTPVPSSTLDFTLPDADRRIITAGTSFVLTENIAVDAAFWYLFSNDQATSDEPFSPPIKGTYEVGAFVASLGLNVTFGAPPLPVPEDGTTAPATEETVAPVATRLPGGAGLGASLR